jgi:methyl-accepting chemotaxis protein
MDVESFITRWLPFGERDSPADSSVTRGTAEDEEHPTQLCPDGGTRQADAEELEATLEAVTAAMEAAAAGDLTRRLDTTRENERAPAAAEAFNEMLASFGQTLDELDEFSGAVTSETEMMSAATEEVKEESEEVDESIEEIRDNAADQYDLLDDISGEMSDLSATIEEIASSATEVAQTSGEAAEYGQTGRDAADEALGEMAAIESRTETTIEQVSRLEDRIEEISDIVASSTTSPTRRTCSR